MSYPQPLACWVIVIPLSYQFDDIILMVSGATIKVPFTTLIHNLFLHFILFLSKMRQIDALSSRAQFTTHILL